MSRLWWLVFFLFERSAALAAIVVIGRPAAWPWATVQAWEQEIVVERIVTHIFIACVKQHTREIEIRRP